MKEDDKTATVTGRTTDKIKAALESEAQKGDRTPSQQLHAVLRERYEKPRRLEDKQLGGGRLKKS